MSEKAEILVIGGGVIGVCIARELALGGHAVTLIERDEICPIRAAVYANAGLITPSDPYPMATPGALGEGLRFLLDSGSPFYVAPWADKGIPRWLALFRHYSNDETVRRAMPLVRSLTRRSADIHEQLGAEHGERYGYHQNGWLWLYQTAEGLEGGVDEARETGPLGISSRIVDPDELPELVPGVARGLVGGVLHEEDAHLTPHLFVREMARQAEAAGATVLPNTEALRLEKSGGRVTRVVTTRGDFTVGTVVVAAGAWTPGLLRQTGLRVPIQAAKGYGVTVDRPEGTAEIPLYHGEKHLCVTPMGETLRLAGTLELAGFDLSIRWKRVERIRQGAAALMPATSALKPRELWRGLRPVTPDGLPVIGRSPRHSNLVIASGHCMEGLGWGPITGRLVAQLVTGGTPEIDLAPLRPDRFGGLLPRRER